MQEDGRDHCQVAGGMGHHGAPEGAGPQAAKSEDRAEACQQKHHERAGDQAEMEARDVMPQAVDVQKMDEAVGEAIDQSGDHGIPTQREGLLDQPTKEELLTDGREAYGQQGDNGKSGCGRHDREHLVELEAVANADAPVVGRVAVESHPDPENEKTAHRPGQGAEE